MKKTNIPWGMLAGMAAILILNAGCSADGGKSADSGGESGQGGSMARFTINGDYLYTVDSYSLNVVSIKDPAEPIAIETVSVGRDIETIFTMKDLLFIGSQGAMYIYDISRPEFPKLKSGISHFRSCDPVVAYENLAFVTLNNSSGSWCGGRGDFLQVYDITDLEKPVQICQINLSSPRGLAVDGEQKIVFVCDNGVKAYDFTDVENTKTIEGLYTAASLPEVKKIDAYDCIAIDGTLLVIGSDGLYQLAYDRDGFTFVSKIDLR